MASTSTLFLALGYGLAGFVFSTVIFYLRKERRDLTALEKELAR